MSISVGQKAPDFTLQNQDKKEVKLSEFAGKRNVVLMWYPLDWSPVCTNEHTCMVNDMKTFDTLDAEVLGGFSSEGRSQREVWNLFGRQGDYRPRDCDRK
jgi:peroxiredoxin